MITPEKLAEPGTEHAHQVALFAWIALNQATYPDLMKAFAIPNGGERNVKVAARMKAEGVRPGVLDIFLPLSRGGYHGLFIEMKKPGKKSATSPEQKKRIEELRADGYGAVVCDHWEQARHMLIEYCRQG